MLLQQACRHGPWLLPTLHTRLESLPVQMPAAGLEEQIQQAIAAVAEAKAAHRKACGESQELNCQLLSAREKALELTEERLIWQCAATGNMRMATLRMTVGCS